MDEIDIPPDGLWDENDARSRTPANGDAVGGPRGAEPGRENALEGSWGGDGGSICRDWNGRGGGGGSSGPVTFVSVRGQVVGEVCQPFPPEPPRDGLRLDGSYGNDIWFRPFVGGGGGRG